jgi:hypothetical protein
LAISVHVSRFLLNIFIYDHWSKIKTPKKNTVKFTRLFVLCIFCVSSLTIYSCKKDDEPKGTDKELFDMAQSSTGFTWYKNSDALLGKSSGSGHPQPFLRTRYNTIAAAKLDSIGKIMTDAKFAEGSLIVKELFENSTTLARYAILYKQTNHADADANGWVWGYMDSNGSVAEPASKKGASCIGCHSQSDNIDYMLMNKYFP